MSAASMQPTYDRERRLIAAGARYVAGIDEVGRGPLAGPVVAAAVIFADSSIPGGLRDSKMLAMPARARLAAEIVASARAVSIASASAAEIDRLNIRVASLLAMARAVHALAVVPDHALVDGLDAAGLGCAATPVVKGDRDVLSIAAASIVAKVARDRMMARLAVAFPRYGFERHAGYATAQHREALARHGPCPAHRLSFRPCAQAR